MARARRQAAKRTPPAKAKRPVDPPVDAPPVDPAPPPPAPPRAPVTPSKPPPPVAPPPPPPPTPVAATPPPAPPVPPRAGLEFGFGEWFAVGVAVVWAICLLVSLITGDSKAVSAASLPMVGATGYVFGKKALRNGKGSP